MTLQFTVRSVICSFLLLAIFCVTAGCRTAPILNIKDAPIKTLSGKELPLDKVTKAIVLAGMELKWQMDVVKPGHIVGTLNLRNHRAIVDCTYDTKTYSIHYKGGKGLVNLEPGQVSGPETEEIHVNYNSWIENLDNAIRRQFIAAEP